MVRTIGPGLSVSNQKGWMEEELRVHLLCIDASGLVLNLELTADVLELQGGPFKGN